MTTFLRSNKNLLLSLLLLIGAAFFIIINQIDYLSKFSTAIVALALLRTTPSVSRGLVLRSPARPSVPDLGKPRPGNRPLRGSTLLLP